MAIDIVVAVFVLSIFGAANVTALWVQMTRGRHMRSSFWRRRAVASNQPR
jgi:hypothetical protein